ncbi:MAG: haloacid dehalogenase-like hydrolase [Anaerolineales bacterium]|nr:haloacid dehalogenase-like hydrolase [Anaerolineales bacterium]MCB8939977.1 haloacid dehalogenase-like hydrolase [Ardenticatenaceae bacterium]
MQKLLLFDIDGTLIRSNGAGRLTLAYALERLFGTSGPLDSYNMSGKTDPRIITDLLTAVGIPAKEIQRQLPAIYELMAEHGQKVFWEKGMTACPGVPDLLAKLAMQDDVLVGLLTGNSQITAPLKLSAAGIDPLQFKVGAYGSDALDRNDLPAIGMARAHQLTGDAFNGNNTVIIGDTPADVLCARAGKATAVAVASGWHAATTLAEYHPDHLFENLSHTEQILEVLLA